MSLTLAPYNDAMRIGQGFNSYTHEICIDGAVVADEAANQKAQVHTIEKPSQVVSYSARAVEKLSDVIHTMNISYPHSIKKGSVTVSGSDTAIDEATFKSADLNIIVTVKVTNQTTLIKSDTRFVPMKGIDPGSQQFNEAYGDCYISGFIEGGEFTGIISIKAIDRSNVDLTVKRIKAKLDGKEKGSVTDFALYSHDSLSSSGSVMENTESHIHVSWMGGGQIKNEYTPWDIDSIFKAAAAFPERVAERPQLTWAILTKYKSNRSFIEWVSNKPVQTLQYDQVSSYTAELFDSYMDYKILLKYVQLIIDDPDGYEPIDKDSLDTSIDTLLGVRLAMRKEQSKIIAAVSVLSRDPGILERQGGWGNGRLPEVLDRLLSQTTGYLAEKSKPSIHKDLVQSNDSPREISSQESFNFSTLIPAEVWRKWMPVPKAVSATPSNSARPQKSSPFSGGVSTIGPPPSEHLDWNNPGNAVESAGKTRALHLQEEIARLKAASSDELEALKERHKEDMAALEKKHSDYEILKSGEQTEIEKTLKRLEEEKNNAVAAVKKEEQGRYAVLQQRTNDLEALANSKTTEIQILQNEKQATLEKLGQEKDAAYKALQDSNKSLNISYENLKKQEHDLATEKASLSSRFTQLTNDKQDADGKISTLRGMIGWAGLSETSVKYNCLPNSYQGWKVMIMHPGSQLALNANREHYDMACGWELNLSYDDEIFHLDKANDSPQTPWTITNMASNKLLTFINGDVNWQVRVREATHPEARGNASKWYIGRGESSGGVTWRLKNAQWGTFIQLVPGHSENGRDARSFSDTNSKDAEWTIIPLYK
ncbi:hypothetical protein F52700_4889 [Fusarium sp. NRRL 52700]|nr:hypothetical protein F52700_4889 [Fusarium sp. NRRL 52700]